jgi:hypothetical protein
VRGKVAAAGLDGRLFFRKTLFNKLALKARQLRFQQLPVAVNVVAMRS